MSDLARLIVLFRPAWGWLGLSIALGLATVLAQVGLMSVAGWFIAAMAIAGVDGGTLNYFTPSAVIRAAAIVRTGGRYGERLVGHEATFRLIAGLRVWLYRRLEPLPLDLRGARSGADLAGRLRGDLDRLETMFLRLLGPLAVGAGATLAGLVWLAALSPRFAVVEAALLALAGLVVPLAVMPSAARLGARRVRRLNRLAITATDLVQALPDVLAFGADAVWRRRLDRHSRALAAADLALARRAALAQAAALLAGQLALWAMVMVAVPLLRQGRLDRPDLVMVALLALALFEAVAAVPAALLGLGAVRESARRVFALADAAPAATGPAPTALPAGPPPRGDLVVADLGFAWPGRPPVFDRLSFAVPRGTRLALVGPSGSGKSTLVLLLAGLIEPQSGRILLDGQPIDRVPVSVRRGCFAVAPQGCGLFSGTLAEGLRLGDPAAAEAALWRVLDLVGLRAFVADLPDGLATWIGEAGLTLSGGQARRLAVARALLRPAPVVILDEPGEGLDPEAEAAMLDRVIDSLGDRSLVLITHRPAGLERMDQVIRLGEPALRAS